jgi:hypothetical protein
MYQVVRADMGDMVPSGKEDYVLRNAIEGLANSTHSAIKSNALIDYEGHPARSFVISDGSRSSWSGLACWDGKRGFLITVRASNAQIAQSAGDDFVKTFHLVSN